MRRRDWFWMVFLAGVFCVMGGQARASTIKSLPWIVSAKKAASLVRGGARLLDVRSLVAWRTLRPRGAVHVDWKDFSPSHGPRRGELLAYKELVSRLAKMGFLWGETFLVVGDPVRGWGEEGRVVWMLRSLGHPRTSLVDGGVSALRKHLGKAWWVSGKPSAQRERIVQTFSRKNMSNISFRWTSRWSVSTEFVRLALKKGSIMRGEIRMIDARERREYLGKTPYGESRGGHLPGAVHLYYRRFLQKDGRLLPRQMLLRLLRAEGLLPSSPVIVYCTGGVRSAWLVVVLHTLGFRDIRNYAGSMWAWSSKDPTRYPLRMGK